MFRVQFLTSEWIYDGASAENRQRMQVFWDRFNAFVKKAEEIETDAAPGVSAGAAYDESRIDKLWLQCMLLVVQTVNLRRRRLSMLRRHPDEFFTIHGRRRHCTSDDIAFLQYMASAHASAEHIKQECRIIEDAYRNSGQARMAYADEVSGGISHEQAYLNTHNGCRTRARRQLDFRDGAPGVSAGAPARTSKCVRAHYCFRFVRSTRRLRRICTRTPMPCSRSCSAPKPRA